MRRVIIKKENEHHTHIFFLFYRVLEIAWALNPMKMND